MEIEKLKLDQYEDCDNCLKDCVNEIKLKHLDVNLCDECLQELNRKIVDYLADKNI